MGLSNESQVYDVSVECQVCVVKAQEFSMFYLTIQLGGRVASEWRVCWILLLCYKKRASVLSGECVLNYEVIHKSKRRSRGEI